MKKDQFVMKENEFPLTFNGHALIEVQWFIHFWALFDSSFSRSRAGNLYIMGLVQTKTKLNLS